VGRNNRTLNLEILPTNYLYSASQYINRRYLTKPIPFRKIGDDAKLVQKAGSKPTLVFLIVGETARNQNQQLQGYPRPTNPYTSQEPDLIYFSKVSSCGTATAVSVPCMFSNMPRTHFDNNIARNSEGLMDILQKAGVSTYWKDNDEGCKGACDRIPTQIVPTNSDKNLCDGDTCYDAVLLNDLDKLIPNDGKNKTLAFHLIGSHGPTYYKRYPKEFRFFMPDCQRSDIENCTQQQLVNTYDNTIRYTDYVVSQFIQRLKGYEKDYNVALYYVSDHGESLGEDGLYLHGTPYKFAPEEQTRVPMEMWLSDSYVKAQGIDRACVASLAKNSEFSHDNLFHTMLSMMNVQTKEYDPNLDILKTCRTQNP
jgi:lipid A ethanolaminephosphotransferase